MHRTIFLISTWLVSCCHVHIFLWPIMYLCSPDSNFRVDKIPHWGHQGRALSQNWEWFGDYLKGTYLCAEGMIYSWVITPLLHICVYIYYLVWNFWCQNVLARVTYCLSFENWFNLWRAIHNPVGPYLSDLELLAYMFSQSESCLGSISW